VVKKINLDAIRIDGGTQPRERIDMEIVGDYAEAVKVGIEFPPIVVFQDGAEYWLADGFHRWHAHKQAGKASIDADVRAGSLLDAKLYAVGANGAHGLRRSNEDKRRAVQMVLDEPAWEGWSDRKIADACGVGHPFVAAIRRPKVAEKQQENRESSAGRKAREVESDSTPAAKASPRELPKADPAAPEVDAEALNEAQNTLIELAEENEQLRDRLAVEGMDASESEKTQASETIRELRAAVKTLEAELDAVKRSRDTFMRENGELKKQCSHWRKQAEKASKATA
jgi:regulator of replication initiation timing/uncharacterized ParB-like nuclease family protein